MRTPQLLVIGLAVLTMASSASAQHRIRKPRSPERVLMDRDREILHPDSNPINLRSLDQGEEGFRSGTPALLRGDVSVARVDNSEMRARRLAMYEGGAHFDTPIAAPAASSASDAGDEPVAPPRAAPDEPREDGSGDSTKMAWMLCFGVAGGIAAFVVIRRR